jgi:hypothetical protein
MKNNNNEVKDPSYFSQPPISSKKISISRKSGQNQDKSEKSGHLAALG